MSDRTQISANYMVGLPLFQVFQPLYQKIEVYCFRRVQIIFIPMGQGVLLRSQSLVERILYSWLRRSNCFIGGGLPSIVLQPKADWAKILLLELEMFFRSQSCQQYQQCSCLPMVESNGLVPSCRIQRRWLGKGLPQSQKRRRPAVYWLHSAKLKEESWLFRNNIVLATDHSDWSRSWLVRIPGRRALMTVRRTAVPSN